MRVTPDAGPDAERGRHRHALQDRVLHRARRDRDRLGRPLLLALPLPRPPRAPAAADLRQHARSSWAGRSRAGGDRVVHRRDHLHLARRASRTRRPSGTGVARRGARPRTPRSTSRRRRAAKALQITVSGQQYIWRYQYPNGAVSFQQMVVPDGHDRRCSDIKANDVAHSWWIPKLGGKVDAIPGYTNKTWFKATATGHLQGPVRGVLRLRPRRHVARR